MTSKDIDLIKEMLQMQKKIDEAMVSRLKMCTKHIVTKTK